MKKVTIVIMILGTIVPSIIFSQKNRISIYTGLFHEYFDGSPMLNTNYHSEGSGFLADRFYNSYGIEYIRKLNSKSQISIEVSGIARGWRYMYPNYTTNVVSGRKFFTVNTTYERWLQISDKFNFTYGGGINYRRGSESVVVSYYIFNANNGLSHSNAVSRMLNDIGLNIRTGIEYTPLKWLTLYTKLNLIGFVYFDHRETIDQLQNVYGYEDYPNWFDLSWRFGVGFNFGK